MQNKWKRKHAEINKKPNEKSKLAAAYKKLARLSVVGAEIGALGRY